MSTGTRVRGPADVLRIGAAVSHPGIDPRTWVCTGRVDDDPGAVRWNAQLGWIADVTITGGPLDGESEVPCRIAGVARGAGTGEFLPVSPGCEVQVVVNAGTLEEGPVIVGTLTNKGGCQAPLTVNGLPVASAPASTPVTVSPQDTELKVSDHNRREQYAGDRTVQAAVQTISADQPLNGVLLGSPLAQEAFVKGTTYLAAQSAFYTNVAAGFKVLSEASVGPLAGLKVGFEAMTLLYAAEAAKQLGYASQKIKGE